MTEGQSTNLHQSKGRRWWLLLALPVALAGVHVARAWAFGGPGMGMGFGPGEGSPGEHEAFMQRRLEKALDMVKATDSQRAAIKPIIQQLATDLKSIHKQHGQLHRAMLDAFGDGRHIANLGHGILPNVPVEHAIAFVETVKNYQYEPVR